MSKISEDAEGPFSLLGALAFHMLLKINVINAVISVLLGTHTPVLFPLALKIEFNTVCFMNYAIP